MTIGISIVLALLVCSEPVSKPNVLFLLADDLGWRDLNCYGSEFHETPHLDRLATEGMMFSQAYAAASLCSPTRASIMTGKHPVRVNITDWIPGAGDKGRKLATPIDNHNLPLTEFTIGEAFLNEGYETFYAGKWHLGNPELGPLQQGFEHYVRTADRTTTAQGQSKRTRLEIPAGERWHLTRFITRESVKFLTEKRDSKRPFFAFVSYHDVHTPMQPDKRFIERFRAKAKTNFKSKDPIEEREGKTRSVQNNPAYASMVRAIDQSVGEILGSLNRARASENTIIVFVSDNGGLSTMRRQGPTCNLPLRAGKGWLYEGGIRVPLIVKYSGKVKSGVVNAEPITTTDLYPTLLEMAGLDLKPKQHVDGLSFASKLMSRENEGTIFKRDLFWHFPHYHGSMWTPGSAVRSGKWKLIRFFETNEIELYDLVNDPGENENLAEQHPKTVDKLNRKLTQWFDTTGALLPSSK